MLSHLHFAKYLPNGRLNKEGNCLDIRTGEIIYYNGNYGEESPDELITVSLFLCSSDICIGDKIFVTKDYVNFFNDTVVEIKSKGYMVLADDLYGEYYYTFKQTFKPIGIISHKATFVRDGDVLIVDGYECQATPLHCHNEDGSIVYVDYDNKPVNGLPIYQVKNTDDGKWY